MWVIISTSKPDEKHSILGDKKYVVGRVGCDIIVNDPSVSRKQAVLMMAHYEANVVKSFITPSLSVEDTSKFGTFVNGESVKKKPGSVMTLKNGDKIQFGGSPSSVFTARYEPFVATTSCLEKVPKKNLQRIMCLLGGHVVRDWRATCDLLIMAKINVTIKVICAINNQKPIVTPDYLDHFHQYLMGDRDIKPDSKDYLPEVADKEVPAGVSFHPDIRRSTLLKELKFFFLSAHQFNKTNLAVSTAGGLPILLEDGTEEDAEVMTQDATIVVAVTKDVLSTLSPTCQKFVRTVCLVLKKKNLRMVTDPEIGWAILTCNTDDFCNPKSAITPSMYSSMASQSLSQMTDMDIDVSNTQHRVTDQQQASNTQHTVTQEHMPPPPQPQKTGVRPGKRPANSVERDSEDLFPDGAKEDGNSSLHSPVSKRIKQEIQVSPSQQNLFSGTDTETLQKTDSHTHMYSAPAFKSPQTPSVTDTAGKQSAEGVKAYKKNVGFDNDSQLSSSASLKGAKNTGSNSAKTAGGRIAASDAHNSSIPSHPINESDDDTCSNGNVSASICENNNKQNGNKMETNNDASVLHISNTSNSKSCGGEKKSSSPSGFLNKKVNSNKVSSSPPPSSTRTSSKGKKKKRALFCDSSDEDDSSMIPSKGNKKKKTENVQNSSDEEHSNSLFSFSNGKEKKSNLNVQNKNGVDVNHDIITEKDFPSSSVICNGDSRVEPVVVKQENSGQVSSAYNASKGSGDECPDHNTIENVTWATVKKEDNIKDEEIANIDLVLDNDGQPLRQLCQVKMVDLIARVPGSRPRKVEASGNSQLEAGVKNFKRFKKTAHCGSSHLPTIIGGRDLEPHKTSRFSHLDDFLEEAVTSANRASEDRNIDDMFNWREEDLVPKRKGKRN